MQMKTVKINLKILNKLLLIESSSQFDRIPKLVRIRVISVLEQSKLELVAISRSQD